MKAQCYLIRHLKKGVLTGNVFLETPSHDELVEICGEADVAAGLVRVVASVLRSENELLASAFEQLDPVVEPEVAPVPAPDKFFKLIAGGTGIVVNPGDK